MRGILFCILLSTVNILFAQSDPLQSASQPLAFPGAEGFGKFVSGGRGGKVYVVTNLDDHGPGSLRDAIKKKEARIITFAVSGTISLESDLDINYGNLTIAGQSAPGDGICIKGFPTKIGADNVIIRYLRFRLGDEKGVQDDAISATRHKDIIVDHCSMSWAVDECASFYSNENFTLQWCIISESLNASVHAKGEHGYGGIWGGRKASFHHNLLASHNSRLPRFSGSASTPNSKDELVDFRNNVIYNWKGNSTYGGERGRYNVVNNYYKPGPATTKSKLTWFLDPSSPLGKFFVQGNFFFGNSGMSANNRDGVKTKSLDSALTLQPFVVEPILEQNAEGSFDLVMSGSGASYRRDAVDTRIVNEVKAGNSKSGKLKNGIIDSQNDVGGWPALGTSPNPPDQDKDGMPDEWETKNGLNPKDPVDASGYKLSKGYTNVEVYLNDLLKNIK